MTCKTEEKQYVKCGIHTKLQEHREEMRMLNRPEESLGIFKIHTQEIVPGIFCTLCYISQQRRKMNCNRERTAKPKTQDVAMPISGKQANG